MDRIRRWTRSPASCARAAPMAAVLRRGGIRHEPRRSELPFECPECERHRPAGTACLPIQPADRNPKWTHVCYPQCAAYLPGVDHSSLPRFSELEGATARGAPAVAAAAARDGATAAIATQPTARAADRDVARAEDIAAITQTAGGDEAADRLGVDEATGVQDGALPATVPGAIEEILETSSAQSYRPVRLTNDQEKRLISELGQEVLQYLPRIQEDGSFNLKAPRALSAVPLASVRKHFNSYFPHQTKFIPKVAELRAQEAKRGVPWSTETREAARNAFVIGSVTFEIYCHELVSHRELHEHERYRVSGSEAVKLACPDCNTNRFVKTPASFRYNVQDKANVRSYHGHRSVIVPLGGTYGFLSLFLSFHWQHELTDNLPLEVRMLQSCVPACDCEAR